MMNKEYYTVVTEILEKRYSKEQLDELQKNAIADGHKILEERSNFESWVADYCLDMIQDLFEEYDVELE